MSGQATCSLSEALTALAFDDPTPVALVPNALKTQRWGCSSDDVLTRLYAAVHTLCDAGYRGDLKIWGRPIRQSGGVAPRLGAPKILNQAECLNRPRLSAGARRTRLQRGIGRQGPGPAGNEGMACAGVGARSRYSRATVTRISRRRSRRWSRSISSDWFAASCRLSEKTMLFASAPTACSSSNSSVATNCDALLTPVRKARIGEREREFAIRFE